jgi:hypothetical protein
VGKNDRTVHPDLQRFVAKRMGATIYEVDSSHVPMLANPKLVIDVSKVGKIPIVLRDKFFYFPGLSETDQELNAQQNLTTGFQNAQRANRTRPSAKTVITQLSVLAMKNAAPRFRLLPQSRLRPPAF